MKGISFKPEMVRATMAGRKNQTRRVVKPQPTIHPFKTGGVKTASWKGDRQTLTLVKRWMITDAPYKEGRIYYLKEAVRECNGGIIYTADDAPVSGLTPEAERWRWKPNTLHAMYMPLVLARTFIRIDKVRVEPVQEISEEDAISEGVEYYTPGPTGMLKGREQQNPSEAYRELWDRINHKEYPWMDNPYVYVYKFEVVKNPAF